MMNKKINSTLVSYETFLYYFPCLICERRSLCPIKPDVDARKYMQMLKPLLLRANWLLSPVVMENGPIQVKTNSPSVCPPVNPSN
jgi:hypothetical protein